MKLNNPNIKNFILSALIHGTASAIVILLNWDLIDRRLSRITIPLLIGYGAISLLLLVTVPFFKKKNYVIVWMTVLPYIAVSIAYAVVTYLWITNRSANATPFEIFPVIVITLTFPYLAIWGPIISIVNAVVVFLLEKSLIKTID